MARILVIDDEESVLATVRKHLTEAGHDVVEASDGRAAMQLLEATPADLIITDLYMPEMDGIEFTIRLGQQAPDAKIIAISGGGHMDKEDVLEIAQRLGAARTLAKPFTGGELLDAVAEVLGGGR